MHYAYKFEVVDIRMWNFYKKTQFDPKGAQSRWLYKKNKWNYYIIYNRVWNFEILIFTFKLILLEKTIKID